MKKFSKIGKRVIAFFLVALMNINTYATTTSNDGSAFVTKAEFDALVKTFNNQMDSYQAGINAKIDAAIAKYIAGMSSTSTTTLVNFLENIVYADKTFVDVATQTYTATGETFQILTASNAIRSRYYGNGSNKSGYVRTNSYSTDESLPVYKTSDDRDSDFKLMYEVWNFNGTDYYYTSKKRSAIKYKVQHKLQVNGSDVGYGEYQVPSMPSTTNWIANSTVKESGDNNINYWVYGNNVTCVCAHTTSLQNYTNGGDYIKYNPGSAFSTTADNAHHYGIDYNNYTDFNSDNQLEVSQKGDNGGSRWYKYLDGSNADRKSDEYTYKFYTQKILDLLPTEWLNYTASVSLHGVVYKINGIPITRIKKGAPAGKVTIPLKITCTAGKCTLAVRSQAFGNERPGVEKGTNDLYWNDNLGTTTGQEVEIQFDVGAVNNDTVYWIKVCPNSPEARATIQENGDIILSTT